MRISLARVTPCLLLFGSVLVSACGDDSLTATDCSYSTVATIRDMYVVGESVDIEWSSVRQNSAAATCSAVARQPRFATSDPSVVAFTDAGKLMALGAGTATVSVQAHGGASAFSKTIRVVAR